MKSVVIAQVIFWGSMALFAETVHAQSSMRSDIAKPLTIAQDALKRNDNQQALIAVEDALKVSLLSRMEHDTIMRTRAVAALRLKKWEIAIESLETLLESSDIPEAEKNTLMESVINASLQSKDQQRVLKWSTLYVKNKGSNPLVHQLMVQALAATGHHDEVVKAMERKHRQDAASGIKTPEPELRIWAFSHRELKDEGGYLAVLKKLLMTYPDKSYWAEMVGRLSQRPGLSSRHELDLYRLLEVTGNLADAPEFIEMAHLALKAGLPVEALRVLEKGFDMKVLSESAHVKLKTEAQKKAQEDEVMFAQLERTAKDGNTWTAIGDVYFSRQDWPAAHAAYVKAIDAGGLRREHEVRLHDAICLFYIGQRELAQSQLSAVKGDEVSVELAQLWRIFMK